MKTSGKNTVIHTAMTLIMVMLIIISTVSGGARIARAAVATPEEFESRGVLEDLQGMTVDGEPFKIEDYPANEHGTPQLITFAEYCYAYYADMQGYYGIYIYVYNPAQTNFEFSSGKSKLQMRIGERGNYKKYTLKLLSATTQSGYNNRFYKLKVELTAAERTQILKALDGDKRIYELSGIELLVKGATNATEYAVGGRDKDGKAYGRKYTYTGYAEGYGVSGANPSTLACEQSGVEVAELEAHSTYYFYPTDLYTATQLNSVYFSLDNKLIDRYGKLYSILAEYWQYELPPIVVVNDDKIYNSLNNAVADLQNAQKDNDYKISIYHYALSGYAYVIWTYSKDLAAVTTTYAKEYNMPDSTTKKPLIFKRDKPTESTISREEIQSKMYELAAETGAPEGELNEFVLRGGKGYTPVYAEADELFDLKGFDTGSSLKNWWLDIIGKNPNNPTIEDIAPIYQITKTDLERDNLANYLMIAQEDVAAFKSYCREEMEKDKTVYLFRYGTSEYREYEAEAVESSGIFPLKKRYQSVRFQTMDLDFDIIQLGFGNRTAQVFVPVVSSPIDIFASSPSMNEIFESVKQDNWWRYAVIISAVLVGVLIIDIIAEKAISRGNKE